MILFYLKSEGESPIGNKGQMLAKNWWDMVIIFTKGDICILRDIFKLNADKDNWNNDCKKKQAMDGGFLGQALGKYLQDNNIQIPNME